MLLNKYLNYILLSLYIIYYFYFFISCFYCFHAFNSIFLLSFFSLLGIKYNIISAGCVQVS